ncbi:MAG TPA: hypothetical protein VF556_12700, partial [Pyrinomonadaceae bacterium]
VEPRVKMFVKELDSDSESLISSGFLAMFVEYKQSSYSYKNFNYKVLATWINYRFQIVQFVLTIYA